MALEITDKQSKLPAKPGVYLFRDHAGNILYVGKAASLLHRVRSYFGSPEALTPKLQRMVAKIADIDFIITDSEQEAIILECNLIKKHHPRYNVCLKDDKSYPYLKISLAEEWPRVYVTRRLEEDGSRYFGPFASAGSLRKTMNLIKKLFPYRTCNKPIAGTDKRPCLEYYIKRCAAPCIGAVSKEEYHQIIKQVILFLEGRQERVVRELKNKMLNAASNLEFEKAASFRDQIQAVERIMEQQKVVSPARIDEDVVAFAQDKNEACVQIFFIRGGKLIGREYFEIEGVQDEKPSRILTSFVEQFYSSGANIPQEILLSTELEDMSLLENWLGSKRGDKVRLQLPRRGKQRRLIDMVVENAQESLEQLRIKWLTDKGKTTAVLGELEEQLHLSRAPQRIECYDISDIYGAAAVGSMVVFEKGRPKSSHYRRFKIKEVKGIDDCAMMREVLRRRFARAKKEQGSWALVPDLVLIDGGRGHLNAVIDVIQELGIESVSVVSIAKENEEIFVPEVVEPIVLHRNSQALYLLQRIRDEAHRFALSYHIKVRKKTALISGLNGVLGIGTKRKRALLQKFGSVKGIKEATLDDLASVPGMTRQLAEKVKKNL